MEPSVRCHVPVDTMGQSVRYFIAMLIVPVLALAIVTVANLVVSALASSALDAPNPSPSPPDTHLLPPRRYASRTLIEHHRTSTLRKEKAICLVGWSAAGAG
jgi:hypothetical protein